MKPYIFFICWVCAIVLVVELPWEDTASGWLFPERKFFLQRRCVLKHWEEATQDSMFIEGMWIDRSTEGHYVCDWYKIDTIWKKVKEAP